jgi:cysteine desulfurase
MKSHLIHILEYDLLHNIDDIKINSTSEQRTYILNVSFKNIDGESLMILLGKDNIYVSTGSACHAKDNSLSHTLTSMNVPKEYINGTIRISIGNNNTEEEIKFVAKRIKENVELLRKYKG